MITIKSAREIEIMRQSGKITAGVLSLLMRTAKAGMTTGDLDRLAEQSIRERGGDADVYGLQRLPARRSARRSTTWSSTGSPATRVLRDGDLLSIDIGTTFDGYVSDSAVTVADRQR